MESMNIEIPFQKQLDVISEVASPLVVITELIKNAFDEYAKEITVEIHTKNNQVEVIDNGNGFEESSIKLLARPGESYKKRDNRIMNPHNKVFAGSMGIGLFSVFSIAEKFEILSKGKDGEFFIKGEQEKISYERVNNRIDKGTKISLINVNESDIKVLIEDIKQDKLKHISLGNYNKEYNLFKLDVKVDGISQNLSAPFVEDLYNSDICNFTSKVVFSFSKDKNELTYQYERKDEPIINSNSITVKFDKDINIGDILNEHYHIKKYEKKEEFVFLPHSAFTVCDFEGAFYIRETNKGYKEIYRFGPAIRMYVNGFGMYNYLERENDWLNLSYLSGTIKNSGLKPMNTIGYIAFNHFVESQEGLVISKERSHFYDKIPYRAFYEIVYKIVTLLTFNIDVAARNKKDWSTYFEKDYLNQYLKNKNGNSTGNGTGRSGTGGNGTGGNGTGGNGTGGNGTGGNGTGGNGTGGNGTEGNGTGGNGTGGNGTGGNGTGGNGTGGNGTGGNGTEGNGTEGNGTGGNGTGGNGTGGNGTGGNGTGGNGTEGNGTGGNGTEGNGTGGNGTEGNGTGGPTPGGASPSTFFEYISWDGKLNPSDKDHVGLIVALDELHKMSKEKIRKYKGYEKVYCVFPVSAGMLLRTAYEQALILQLKKTGKWSGLKAKFQFPMLSNIENHISKNISTVFPDENMRKSFNSIKSNQFRNFLNSNIHNPGLIRTTSSTLEGITNGGMYSLIDLIIKNI